MAADVSRDNADSSLNAAHGGAIVSQVEHSKLLPWLMLTCLLSGTALGLSVWSVISYSRDYHELEREYRLQRLETDEMNVRLELAKIPKHKPGDSP